MGDSEAEVENDSIPLVQRKPPWLSKTVDGCLLIIMDYYSRCTWILNRSEVGPGVGWAHDTKPAQFCNKFNKLA